MRAWVTLLVLPLVGCGATGFHVVKNEGAPALPAAPSADVVDTAPAGAQELGRVEVIGFAGDACKSEARERARTLLGASVVVVAPHPDPFSWQNTEPSTLAAPRCVGTGYAAGASPAQSPATDTAATPTPSPSPAPAPAPAPSALPAPAPAP